MSSSFLARISDGSMKGVYQSNSFHLSNLPSWTAEADFVLAATLSQFSYFGLFVTCLNHKNSEKGIPIDSREYYMGGSRQ